MRYYSTEAEWIAGCDLHNRSVYVVVLQRGGKVVLDRNFRRDKATLLELLGKFGPSVAVACESVNLWTWLRDICVEAEVPFYLGDAKQVAGPRFRRSKSDKEDAHQIANLLALGKLPVAYAYPSNLIALRGLNRDRLALVGECDRISGRLRAIAQEHGLSGRTAELLGMEQAEIRAAFANPLVEERISVLLEQLRRARRSRIRLARRIRKEIFSFGREMKLLQSIPGVGFLTAATVLLEVGEFNRFENDGEFRAASGLVNRYRTSAGKRVGRRFRDGNPYLKRALVGAAVFAARMDEGIKKQLWKLSRNRRRTEANCILANRIASAMFAMIKSGESFDSLRFARG